MVWVEISANLNAAQNPVFHVSQRSVRDRFKLLEKRFREKQRQEELAPGISPEQTEIEIALEEMGLAVSCESKYNLLKRKV